MCVCRYVWSSRFLVLSSIAQSICEWAFSLLEIRFQRSWVRILHSAEEDNWSPFDSISLAYYQCIKINTNKHVCIYVCMYVHVCMHACM